MTATQDRILNAKDLVQMGFPRPTVYAMLNRADFPTIQIGRRLFVRESQLTKWLAEHEGTQERED